MLTIIESESSVWTVVAEDGDLRVYNRGEEGEWSELSLSDGDQTAPDKNVLLEELYVRQVCDDGQERDEPRGEEDEQDEDESQDEPEMQDEEESGDDEEDEDSEAKRPRRRRTRTTAKR